MLEQMSWQQFLEWQEYAAIEPFGEERADLRTGIVASTIANVNRAKGQKAFRPTDFVLKFDHPTPASGKPVSTGARKPLTDLNEWAQIKARAKAIGQGMR